MSAPPGFAPSTNVAPERHREGGTIPRNLRDEIARRFMAEFPGMTGATAVRYAKEMLRDRERFLAAMNRPRLGRLDPVRLARLMEELPLGLPRTKKAARHGNDYRPRNDAGRLIGEVAR